MKRTLLLIPLIILVATGIILWWYSAVKPASTDSTLKDFLIVKGSSAAQIGNKLFKEGLIKNPLAFKLYVQITSKARSIPAGEFRLSPSYSLFKLVDELVRGPREIWVTIPEGLRKEEIAARFASSFDQGDVFIEEFVEASKGMEGFLFPDTYLFPKEASASAVVKKMRSTFDVKTAEFEEEIASSSLSLNEIVTLASIVERETKTNEERPVVAGILLNRLDIGMGLQADATVQYAIASSKCVSNDCQWWPQITREDLEIASPYNTYRFKGLPPAPIASPGISSLRAAIIPSSTDYLYYLHDAKGEIHYAETLEEHNANVRNYLGK